MSGAYGRGQGRRQGQRFVLERALGGRRLEEIVSAFQPSLSRSAVARLIKRGGVRVGGQLLRRSGMRIAFGAQIEVDWEAGQERPGNERPVRSDKSAQDAHFGRDYAGPVGDEPGDRKPRDDVRGGAAQSRDGRQNDAPKPASGIDAGPSGYRRGSSSPRQDAQPENTRDYQAEPEPQEPNCLEAGEPAHRLLPGVDRAHLAELVEAAARLDVIYSDDEIVVVNKPGGMLTHATEKHPHGSLADLARLRFGRMPLIMGDERPGIVHRLDRETSGAIVLARTPEAMDDLREQFRNREVEKVYLAICHRNADFDETVLDWDLDQKPGGTDRQEYLAKGEGKDAVTEVLVEERFGHATLVSCVPRTGRRHQIRVHLYAAGLPIVGDVLYGGRKAPDLPPGAPRMRRHGLHAVELTLRHPSTGEVLGFGAEMPADMEQLLDWLRG